MEVSDEESESDSEEEEESLGTDDIFESQFLNPIQIQNKAIL